MTEVRPIKKDGCRWQPSFLMNLFLLLRRDLDMQLIQLLLLHGGGSAHHDVLGVLVHGEGDDLPDGAFAGQQHHHAVHARGDAGMGRRTVAEGVVHGGELLLHVLLAQPHQLEGFHHDLRVVVPDGAAAELHAVAHQIVLVGSDGQGIDLAPLGLQQHLQPAAGHGEGVVAELQLTAFVADLVHGEVHDPAELVALLIHVTGAGGAEGLDEYTGGLGGCCAGRHHHQRIGCQRQNLLQLGPQASDELGDTAGQLALLIHLEPVGLAAGLHLAVGQQLLHLLAGQGAVADGHHLYGLALEGLELAGDEQLLMLTFSRAAASEFRRRLWDLIGTAAGYVEIKTFHSYCFDLLGLQGSLEKSSSVIIDAVGKIDNGEVEINRITKTVLVIDEAQDMTEDEFALVEALIRKNEDLKVVAVGDDDQNIYSFRRSNSRYMRKLVDEYGARTHDLLVNFRSKKCLVEFANRFWETIPERMKQSRIISHDQDEGEIRIVQYQSPNMVIPLVQDICATPLIGTTCVLTQTNWEAIQVACLLKDKRMPVRLIQSNEGFRLCDMDEMRFFNRILGSQAEVHLIDEVCWAEAKQAIKNEYCEAASWEICRGIIQNFEQLYPCKYRSDWETYLFESKLEDFYAVRGETIVVSTIHKAKGKEFDNVFLLLNDNRDLLEDNQPVTDEKRREIYVALTRAKNKLSIHLNSYYPEIFGNEEKIIRFDKAYYPMPERLLFLLTHRDVWLDFFKDARRQESIGNLKSGMPLRLMEGGCCDSSDKEVVRFSNSFKKEIEKWLDKGYELKEARVNFVVYWKKTGEEEEVKVLLPEIVLVKVRNLNVSELMIL